jgi:hypothetical protein
MSWRGSLVAVAGLAVVGCGGRTAAVDAGADAAAFEHPPATDANLTHCSSQIPTIPVEPCNPGQICTPVQPLEAEVRVCLDPCTLPAGSECADGFECAPGLWDYTGAYACLPRGASLPEQPCEVPQYTTSTGCVAGYECGAGSVCRRICNYLDGSAPCPGGQRCYRGLVATTGWGVCAPPGDGAALGQPCASPLGTSCAPAPGTDQGICMAFTQGGPAMCSQLCDGITLLCPSGQQCGAVWIASNGTSTGCVPM